MSYEWWHSWCHVICQATVAVSGVCTAGSMQNEGNVWWRESGTSLRTGNRDKWGKVIEEYCVREVMEGSDENFLVTVYRPTEATSEELYILRCMLSGFFSPHKSSQSIKLMPSFPNPLLHTLYKCLNIYNNTNSLEAKIKKNLFGYSDNKFISLLCKSLLEHLYPSGIITNPQFIA